MAIIEACSAQKTASQQTEYMKSISAHAIETPRPAVPSYPARDAFRDHAVKLSAAQRKWLLRIMRSTTYGKEDKPFLHFAPIAAKGVPLVVYVDDDPPTIGQHIIGAPCNLYFNARAGTVFPATEGACAPPTPLPVVP